MIHLLSSEAFAALMCLLLGAIVAAWGPAAGTTADKILAAVGAVVACRAVAAGRRCVWPAGVDFTARVALVTGASSGVGFATTRELALHGWTVIMAGRDLGRLLEARRRIMAAAPRGRVVVLGTVDLANLDSVREYAATVLAQKEQFPLALLVNAAGVLRRHLHRRKDSGLEEMIATNVVGPMLLTELLLSLLDETAERTGVTSRIVNVASSCHTFLGVRQRLSPMEMLKALHPSPIGEVEEVKNEEEEEEKKEVVKNEKEIPAAIEEFTFGNFVGYYGLSKLCVIWWTSILARRVAMRCFQSGNKRQLKIFVACCHPGVITTHLYRDLFPLTILDYFIYYPSLLIGKTWSESAQAVLKVCVEPDNMVHGGYYLCSGEYGADSGVNCLSKHAMDIRAAQEFYTWAEEQIKMQKNRPKEKEDNADIVAQQQQKGVRRIMTVKIT
ncbi:Short-chain dehydrogenase/reductase SDR [Trypanosoma melophagium]|uniref:Short-chain dehydrogenase/reductase SDR n=1 Tax=Trypanosoma melophagium TaxID=715481 RepID=UPI00351A0663|nr:Short-chain dehydrogenase/reductase SDR [Trypanosoma melophagium]